MRSVSFAWPWLLTLLLAVPFAAAAAVWLERRPSRYAVAFSNFDVLAGVVAPRRSLRRLVPLVLFLLALAAATAALARPRVPVALPAQRATVVLLVDVSGSMRASDVKPTRLGAAQVAMTDFLARVPSGYRVGLVSFSSEPDVLVEPTTDRDVMREGLNLLYPDAGTAIGDGLAKATQVALDSVSTLPRGSDGKRSAAIIMLSDGAQTRGILTPQQGAARAQAAGIRVDTIALGTAAGTLRLGGPTPGGANVPPGLGGPQRISVPPDPGTLRAIAQETGGRTFTAASSRKVQEVFHRLGTRLKAGGGRREVSSWFAGAAAALLLGSLGAARLTAARLP